MPKPKNFVKLKLWERHQIKKYFIEGYTYAELAIMYKAPIKQIKELTRYLVPVERV